MDPNETLKQIEENFLAYTAQGDDDLPEETQELVEDLGEWIRRGGFEPDWIKYPTGAAVYRFMRRFPGGAKAWM